MSAVRAAQTALGRARREAAASERAVAAAEHRASQAQGALTAARERAQSARWAALRAEHDLEVARRAPADPAPPPRTRAGASRPPEQPIALPRPLRAPPTRAEADDVSDGDAASRRRRGHAAPASTARQRHGHAASASTGRARRAHAASPVRDAPAVTAHARQRASPPSPRARAAALAALQDLLPDRITARFGKTSRELRLEAGAAYRVEPLNAAKKRHRGRVGTLLTWDVSGTSGVIEWSDGGARDSVALADLVRL